MTYDESALADELHALGREIAGMEAVETDRIALAVMERLADEPLPSRWTRLSGWVRHRARLALAVLLVFLAGLVLVPPVRAAVADFFGFGGVLVRPGPVITSAPPPPSVPPKVTLAEAERLAGFKPAPPRSLGPPDGIKVSDDHRIVSMTWLKGPDGPVRVDQFDARLDYSYIKGVSGPVRFTDMAGGPAVWFPKPHELRLLEPNGVARTEAARPAGPTLVWELSGTTLRLEGVKDLPTAIAVAETS
jgi:hypothetical protein